MDIARPQNPDLMINLEELLIAIPLFEQPNTTAYLGMT